MQRSRRKRPRSVRLLWASLLLLRRVARARSRASPGVIRWRCRRGLCFSSGLRWTFSKVLLAVSTYSKIQRILHSSFGVSSWLAAVLAA